MTDQAVPVRRSLTRNDRSSLILDTAERLFYAHGVRAVGMDELVRQTGLSKMSVYRLFPTKDVLVGAYLERRAARLLTLIDAGIAEHAADPRAALLGIVEAVMRDTARADFRGCPFNNASVEFDDPAHPARLAAVGYKGALLTRLTELSERLQPGRGAGLAARLHVLIDGIYLSAAMLGAAGPASIGRTLAEELIDAI
jgi:AcrR family transcriptional regulator